MNINKIIKTSEEISTLQPEFSVNLGRTNIQITICQVPEKRCKTKRNKRHDDYSDESSYDEDDQWSDDDFYYDNEDNSLEYENEWQNYKYSCCANCKAFCCAHFCPLCYVPLMFSRANECCCTVCCCPCALCTLRTKIRAQNKIKGSIFGDYLAFCFPISGCSMGQLMLEIKGDNIHHHN